MATGVDGRLGRRAVRPAVKPESQPAGENATTLFLSPMVNHARGHENKPQDATSSVARKVCAHTERN